MQSSPAPMGASAKLQPNVWHRVHPLTPLITMGGRVFAGIFVLVAMIGNSLQNVISDLIAGREALQGESELLGKIPGLAVVLVIVGLLVLIAAGFGLLFWQWRMTSYRYDNSVVEFKHGIIAKAHRHASYQRVQSVDVQQQFIPRLFGLASLVFDVAGGNDSNIKIFYLSRAQAEQLRDIILSNVRAAKTQAPQTEAGVENASGASAIEEYRAQPGHQRTQNQPNQSGHEVGGTQHNPQAPGMPAGARIVAALEGAGRVGEDLSATFEELLAPYVRRRLLQADGELVRVPLHRTIMAALLTSSAIFLISLMLLFLAALGVFIALAANGVVTPRTVIAAISSAVPGIVGVGFAVMQSVVNGLKHGNFSARLTGDGIQISQGILSTERLLVPLDRLQAIEVRQPLLWRIPGWYRVLYNTAGGPGKSSGTEGQLLLPVGKLDDVMTLMGLVLPDGVGQTRTGAQVVPGAVVHEALVGTFAKPGPAPGLFVRQPERTRLLDPFGLGRNGWVDTRAAMIIRRGRLNRSAMFVPHARVQSLGWQQGPIQRRFGVATVQLHSTRGPVRPFIAHIDQQQARNLLFGYAAVTQRARAAMDAA